MKERYEGHRSRCHSDVRLQAIEMQAAFEARKSKENGILKTLGKTQPG